MSTDQTNNDVPQHENVSQTNSTNTKILVGKPRSDLERQIRRVSVNGTGRKEAFILKAYGLDPEYPEGIKESSKSESHKQEKPQKPCPHYDECTHVCKLDGTAWCPFPLTEFCGARNERRRHWNPTRC